MKNKTTKEYILQYLNHGNWVSSAVIDEEVGHIAKKKAATVSRGCRLLAEEEKLEKEYRGGVVWYKINESVRKKKQVVEIIEDNGVRKAIIRYI